ncbi:unnamed protein product [Echinostoma caproni]|uniref:DDE_5 domain-containing protein n=1 Tax=Echinostoma caproni TaxID=27848 RepID=A0A183AQS6_9TREM|nr:unnamed protein product [Echinostoma caproni]
MLDTESDLSDENRNEGSVLLVAPGGVREALFSNEYYSVVWGRRHGFAKVAILARQPRYGRGQVSWVVAGHPSVAPREMFLCDQASQIASAVKTLFTAFPWTYIGDPIYPMDGETPEQLADRVREEIESMIRTYQWTPANLLCALLQRIPAFDRWFHRRKSQRNASQSNISG